MREPALIFDFGNVVAFFSYARAYERLARKFGAQAEGLRERFLEPGFAEVLRHFETGAAGPEVFASHVMALAGFKLSYEEFALAWEDIFWLNEPVAHLVEYLKARGYTLILGSNTNVLHATRFRRQFASTLNQFDRLILSHEVGCLKPDRAFYEACVAAAGVPAASCLFLDDLAPNVEGARRAGLGALQYLDAPQLLADLRRLGIEVPPGEC
jgi:putative hydrolase of the HAD superfamily